MTVTLFVGQQREAEVGVVHCEHSVDWMQRSVGEQCADVVALRRFVKVEVPLS
ncbi:MAG: hypothetical protein ACXW16_00900 [Burkholderiaceae bacterium]